MADDESQRGAIRAVLTTGMKIGGAVVNAGAAISGSVTMPSIIDNASVVVVEIEGVDYPVKSTINGTPTAKSYDLTIL